MPLLAEGICTLQLAGCDINWVSGGWWSLLPVMKEDHENRHGQRSLAVHHPANSVPVCAASSCRGWKWTICSGSYFFRHAGFAWNSWHWKITVVNVHCGSEKTKWHLMLLAKNVQSNEWPFKFLVFCRVHQALNSGARVLRDMKLYICKEWSKDV